MAAADADSASDDDDDKEEDGNYTVVSSVVVAADKWYGNYLCISSPRQQRGQFDNDLTGQA